MDFGKSKRKSLAIEGSYYTLRPPENMNISEQRFLKGTVVVVSGQLESGSAPGAQAQLDKLTDPASPMFVFDCTELKYVSSAGLRVFLFIAKKVKTQHKAKVALAGLNPMVHEIFEISGFSAVFSFHKDIAALDLGTPLPLGGAA